MGCSEPQVLAFVSPYDGPFDLRFKTDLKHLRKFDIRCGDLPNFGALLADSPKVDTLMVLGDALMRYPGTLRRYQFPALRNEVNNPGSPFDDFDATPVVEAVVSTLSNRWIFPLLERIYVRGDRPSALGIGADKWQGWSRRLRGFGISLDSYS